MQRNVEALHGFRHRATGRIDEFQVSVVAGQAPLLRAQQMALVFSGAEGGPQMHARFDSIDQHRSGSWGPNNQDRKWDQQELLEWCRQSRSGETSLGQLIELAAEAIRLVPGEMRLIGWTKQEVPGMSISPSGAQVTRHTLFLVHLDPGILPEPKSDLRMWSDIMDEVTPENAAELFGEIGLGAPKP